MSGGEPSLTLGPDLAAVLGVLTDAPRAAAAERLAELADLPCPKSPAAHLVLSEIVVAIQRDLIDHPDIPMDRAVAADTALSRGCIRAGPDAVRETQRELGKQSLDVNVRATLDMKIAPELAKRGAVKLVAEPR